MPFMRITLGLDGFWHCDLIQLLKSDGCKAPLTDKGIYIGGAGKDAMPEPPRHEMCPVCMPIRTPRGNLPGEQVRQLFQLGFQEAKLLKGNPDQVVLTNPNSPCLAQVWVMLHGPNTVADRWYDAREGFDLRTFHVWWELITARISGSRAAREPDKTDWQKADEAAADAWIIEIADEAVGLGSKKSTTDPS